MAYKPGFVPRTMTVQAMTIRLGRRLPGRLARPTRATARKRAWPHSIPSGMVGRAAPIRSCSRWGLPCRPRCRGRGALLPHPFTLTDGEPSAVCFLWHCP